MGEGLAMAADRTSSCESLVKKDGHSGTHPHERGSLLGVCTRLSGAEDSGSCVYGLTYF
ncbi:hypothetical protein JOC55_005878 [Paenibacillus sacheonensis]|nr:hypothetical protein [Paenibacillus sacheonensis]